MTEPSTTLGSSTALTRDGLSVVVADAPARSRVEATVDGTLAAYTEYVPSDEAHVDFVHTVTEPDWSGRGIASILAHEALGLVRAANRRVIPHCPFIATYIHRHEEFADLVDEEHKSLLRPAS